MRVLLQRAQDGDEHAVERIVREFRGFAVSRTTGMFLPGGDRDDLIAEALVGLLKAIRDYRPGRGASFIHFAALCIDRQLFTAVKTANREKHRAANEAIAVTRNVDGEEMDAVDLVPAPEVNHPARMEALEQLRRLAVFICEHLSDLEMIAYVGWLNSEPYEAIARDWSIDAKAVDNALQRAHSKVRGLSDAGLREAA